MKKLLTILLVLFLTGVVHAENRVINIVGDIDMVMAFEVREKLVELDQTTGEITIFIDSSGGSVTYGFMIIDHMKVCKNTIRTVVLSKAFSMGAVILSAGTKGHRYAYRHSTIMLHQMSIKGRMDLPIDKFYKHVEMLSLLELWGCEEIGRNTGHTALEVRTYIQQDRWMSAQRALEYGLIDKIIGGR